MPQTVEAINHAKAAEVPIIVAINKCDVQGADPSRVKQQLLEHGLIPEEYGGQIVTCEVSAKTGDGVEDLLDNVLLVAEILELQGNPRLVPEGTVIEAHLEKGRGPVATILVRDGSLKQGDSLVVGASYGRVRTMTDHEGNTLKSAGPSSPVEVIGLNEVPQVGEAIEVAKNSAGAQVPKTTPPSGEPGCKRRSRWPREDLRSVRPARSITSTWFKATQGSVEAISQVKGYKTSTWRSTWSPASARSTRPLSTWQSTTRDSSVQHSSRRRATPDDVVRDRL